jgi:hypothetical protein
MTPEEDRAREIIRARIQIVLGASAIIGPDDADYLIVSFAAAIAEEREACAKVAEADEPEEGWPYADKDRIAAAIRARAHTSDPSSTSASSSS